MTVAELIKDLQKHYKPDDIIMVSVDVSTGENDAEDRVFGKVFDTNPYLNEVVLLCHLEK